MRYYRAKPVGRIRRLRRHPASLLMALCLSGLRALLRCGPDKMF
ncbi:hypothetical protein CKO_01973 [Citrobacter koseri ATCC BAA-895]|uniref:Uncharacterized protein n=1 Tax=Citrobacter koseri (strain ATCC BAA-895 / CDC 4225-83 / SGSC4696) TaxID=290338 RepID=A8AHY6_CITK8|nr:hypothetical protein CKO_01973 [Citrobacter koseri ATCC BAA-895]